MRLPKRRRRTVVENPLSLLNFLFSPKVTSSTEGAEKDLRLAVFELNVLFLRVKKIILSGRKFVFN